MKILVTGGAGFVGSNLALKLKENGFSTLVLDNLKRRGSELNLERLKSCGIPFFHGDIRCREDIESPGPVDLILECSAEPSVLAGLNDSPHYVIQTNLNGTLNCLEIARKWKSAFLFLSTSRVYPIALLNQLSYSETDFRFELTEHQKIPGVSPQGISEDFPLQGSRSIYGATKLASELMIQEYAEAYNLACVINRCGVISGSWQMGKIDQGVVVLWVARHIYGKPLSYIGYGGEGKQVRDILHIQDLFRLVLWQIQNLEQCRGKIYNVGGGREISLSLLELTSLCQKYTGKKIPIEKVSANRSADIPLYLTDCTRVTRETGWKAEISAEKIVEEIALWIEKHKEKLRPILD